MAKQTGPQKLRGTIDGLTYYKTQDGYLAKKKSGVSRERLKKDPAYQPFRQHQSEFGACAKAAKLLRDTLMPVLEQSIDNRLTPRLNKVMNSIKNLDEVSGPGRRRVGTGLKTMAGKALLKGFNFNCKSDLARVCSILPQVGRRQGQVILNLANPVLNLNWPRGATHVALHCGLARMDFTKKKGELLEDSVLLPLNSDAKRVVLKPEGNLSAKGLRVLVLKIVFFVETNGQKVMVGDQRFNAAMVVDVWE